MVKVCFLLLLAVVGCAGKNDSLTGVRMAHAENRNVVFLPPSEQSPTPEEYGVQFLELAVTWRDSQSDSTPMGDEEFVARAAVIVREAQATGCADGIQ